MVGIWSLCWGLVCNLKKKLNSFAVEYNCRNLVSFPLSSIGVLTSSLMVKAPRSASMSLANDFKYSQYPAINVKLQALTRPDDKTDDICIDWASKNPNGVFQSNGTLQKKVFINYIYWRRNSILNLTVTKLENSIQKHHFPNRWWSTNRTKSKTSVQGCMEVLI